MGFRYTGIRVRDLDRSIAFYTKVLGMQVTWRMRIRETGGAIAVLKSPRGSQRLELNWYPPRGRYRVYRQGDEQKSTRLNSRHDQISYAGFCLKKKKQTRPPSPSPERLSSLRRPHA